MGKFVWLVALVRYSDLENRAMRRNAKRPFAVMLNRSPHKSLDIHHTPAVLSIPHLREVSIMWLQQQVTDTLCCDAVVRVDMGMPCSSYCVRQEQHSHATVAIQIYMLEREKTIETKERQDTKRTSKYGIFPVCRRPQ